MAPSRWMVLAIGGSAGFLVYLDATIVNIAFPGIEAAFPDASRAGLSWVLSAYNIVFAALLVPAGRLGDLIGQRRLFLSGLVVFTLASALCAAAPTAEALVGARVLQAIGGAMLVPAAIALVLAAFPVEQRATAVGLITALGGIAAATGPTLGGLLIEVADWRLIFLVNVPIGIGAAVAARGRLPVGEIKAGQRLPDLAGSVLVVLAVGLLALGIVQGEEWGWGSAGVLAAFAGSAALTPLVIWRSARHASPVIALELFRERSFSVGNLGSLLISSALFSMILVNVLFLTSVWEYSLLTAGLAVTPAPLTATLLAGIVGRLGDRVDSRILALPGALAFIASGMWFITQVGPTPDYAAEWLPGAFLAGVGIGFAWTAFSTASLSSLQGEAFGVGSALNTMLRQVGAVLGIAFVIAVVGTPTPLEAPAAFDRGWMVTVISAAAAIVAVALLGRSARPEPEAGAEIEAGAAPVAAGA